MRKLLGTLKVYESDENCVSALVAPRTGKTYELELCPKSRHGFGLEQTNQVQIFAHELGHFVGHILRLPEHMKSRKAVRNAHEIGLHKSETSLVPVENEAWQVAEMIVPGASDSPAYALSMRNYRRHDTALFEAMDMDGVPPYVQDALRGL